MVLIVWDGTRENDKAQHESIENLDMGDGNGRWGILVRGTNSEVRNVAIVLIFYLYVFLFRLTRYTSQIALQWCCTIQTLVTTWIHRRTERVRSYVFYKILCKYVFASTDKLSLPCL